MYSQADRYCPFNLIQLPTNYGSRANLHLFTMEEAEKMVTSFTFRVCMFSLGYEPEIKIYLSINTKIDLLRGYRCLLLSIEHCSVTSHSA